MKALIIEDEAAAAENLIHHLKTIASDLEILGIIDTVKQAVSWFEEQHDVDIIFMDIELADGHSFEIIDQVDIKVPIIFTTAYDQYAIDAFKVNSVDYLLKPITQENLQKAVEKYHTYHGQKESPMDYSVLLQTLQQQMKPNNRGTILVFEKDKMIPIEVGDLAYIYIDLGIVKAVGFDKREFVLDDKLDDLERSLDPVEFVRANRQFIVQRKAIVDVTFYFNGRLIINASPKASEKIIVSKAKATVFKNWLQGKG